MLSRKCKFYLTNLEACATNLCHMNISSHTLSFPSPQPAWQGPFCTLWYRLTSLGWYIRHVPGNREHHAVLLVLDCCQSRHGDREWDIGGVGLLLSADRMPTAFPRASVPLHLQNVGRLELTSSAFGGWTPRGSPLAVQILLNYLNSMGPPTLIFRAFYLSHCMIQYFTIYSKNSVNKQYLQC